jgi:hypothetical protein
VYDDTYGIAPGTYIGYNYFTGSTNGYTIFYSGTEDRWCVAPNLGDPCELFGPSPITDTCPDLYSEFFNSGVCVITPVPTSPCLAFDFDAVFDCLVPESPTPTPTNTPTPTPTPIPLSAFTVTLLEVGSDVVMSGYGGFNITDLTYVSTGGYGSGLNPQGGVFLLGSLPTTLDLYTGSTFSGTSSFGGLPTGTTLTTNSGYLLGIFPLNNLAVPTGYVSGTFISGSTTYLNKTISGLAATPGTYIYTWGSGSNVSKLTLQIGP